MDKYFDHECVKVILDREREAIRLKWKGKVPLDIYKEALITCSNLMIKEGIYKILVDQREIEILSDTAQKWLYREWFPKLIDTIGSNIKMAIIPSPITFRDISSKSIAKKLADKFHDMKIEYYQSERRAFEFLKDQ